MLRRKTIVLTAIVVTLVFGAGHGCSLLGPSKNQVGVEQLRDCFEAVPGGTVIHGVELESAPRFDFECVVACLKPANAGSTLFVNHQTNVPFFGLVKDRDRMLIALENLEKSGCVSIWSTRPSNGVIKGKYPCYLVRTGLEDVPISLNGNVIDKRNAPVQALLKPTVRSDGRVQLHIIADFREHQSVAERARDFDSPATTTGQCSLMLEEGQTCCIGGARLKFDDSEMVGLPFAKGLPGIGPFCTWQREGEAEGELLVLITRKKSVDNGSKR